jgi:hypothetical protein
MMIIMPGYISSVKHYSKVSLSSGAKVFDQIDICLIICHFMIPKPLQRIWGLFKDRQGWLGFRQRSHHHP